MADDILTVEHLSKRFGKDEPPEIEDLSFAIPQGGRVTLFAPTGAGKTTLINILSGLELADGGSFGLAAHQPATIFQEPRLFPYMTLEENVFLPLKLKRRPVTAAVREAYERWLAVCELAPYVRHYPYQLSGGMKQKVALIRGFLTEPDFVMMDEPFKSLDQRAKVAIINHILATHTGISLLFVTHTIEEVPLLTQSVMLFKTSRLGEYSVHDASDLDAILREAIYG